MNLQYSKRNLRSSISLQPNTEWENQIQQKQRTKANEWR